MKTLLLALLTSAAASAASVSDHLGLELWSLHALADKSGPQAALAETEALGFRYVEGGPPAGMSVDAYKAELARHRIEIVSMGVDYAALARDVSASVATAKALGVQYVMLAWVPHEGDTFTEAEALKASGDFNAWGAAFRAAGIGFTYHAHGYEFRPRAGGGTLFDLIAQRTNPEFVNFEMDVFWVTHGGQDPVALMKKYPTRWKMMHVKDIRRGAPTGLYTGHAPATDDVVVGTGQVDWPSVLAQARAVGVDWYFIEDESTDPIGHIPRSVAYLATVKP